MRQFDRIDGNPYAKAFHFDGNNIGILLIHGFTGTPGHMLKLGEDFHKDGYTVLGIQLPGHGTHIYDIETVTWQDWMKACRDGVNRLAETCDYIFVCGLSMGGVLTLLMAEELPITGAMPIAAPIHIYNPLMPYTPILKHFIRFHGGRKPPRTDKHPYDFGYTATPMKAVPHLGRLMKTAQRNLDKITCPMLIVQGLEDHTVKPKSAQIIYDGTVNCTQKELLWLEKSPHVCTLEPEYDILIEKLRRFIKENLNIG